MQMRHICKFVLQSSVFAHQQYKSDDRQWKRADSESETENVTTCVPGMWRETKDEGDRPQQRTSLGGSQRTALAETLSTTCPTPAAPSSKCPQHLTSKWKQKLRLERQVFPSVPLRSNGRLRGSHGEASHLTPPLSPTNTFLTSWCRHVTACVCTRYHHVYPVTEWLRELVT